MGSGSIRLVAGIFAGTLTLTTGCEAQGLSRRELVSQGDRVCKKTADELNPLFTRLFPTGNETPPAPEAAPTMRRAARLVREEAETLSKLEPREQLRDDYRPIVRGLREGAAVLEDSAELASRGDTQGYLQRLQDANRVDQDTRDLMVEFGFRDCGGAS